MKTYALAALLLAGCAHTEVGVDPVSVNPIYPPLFDVTNIKKQLIETQREAKKLKEFVKQSGGLVMLQSSIDIYLVSAQNLYEEIIYAPPAQVRYEPWQIQD
jgi:hypothetical protein